MYRREYGARESVVGRGGGLNAQTRQTEALVRTRERARGGGGNGNRRHMETCVPSTRVLSRAPLALLD